MKYRAVTNLVDFDGRFYSKGEEVELDGSKKHSVYLKPLDEVRPVPVETSTLSGTRRRSTGTRKKKAE